MKISVRSRLDVRLTTIIVVGLLGFSAVAGWFTYRYAFQRAIEDADALQRQLVRTVQTQAEVAAFAANQRIAREVLEGLVANPTIEAVGLVSKDGFRAELGAAFGTQARPGRSYPLFSPVDHIESIGELVVVQNDAEVRRMAARVAVFQVTLMLGLVLAATVLLAGALRYMIVVPITRLATALAAIQPGSAARLTVDARHGQDEIGQLAISANAILDATEAALYEVSAQRNELERLATHDHLTGLATMRVAEDRLHVACTAARRANEKVALLFVDLDGFKEINDRHGHAAGDAALREVAGRLRRSVRAEDTVARVGGDEFVLILAGLQDARAAGQVAENICGVVAAPIQAADFTATLGASIGIAVFPDHTGDVSRMRHLADLAMYRVKKGGKGAFAFADASWA